MPHRLNDVVVVLPGIMGSELRNADGDMIWGTSLGSLVKGVLTRGKAIKRLQLPEGIGDGDAPDGVVATRLLPDIHVIPGIWSVSIGYERMVKWFRENFELVEQSDDPQRPVNFVQFPYDWRLSNRASAHALGRRVEPVLERFRAADGNDDARLVLIGHSMGGLVARYYVDVLGGHEITRKVVTLGTPHRGALNALTSLVNGIEKGWGPLKIDLTGFARSMPSLHQLLPEYACIEQPSGLAKTTELSLPEVSTTMVADAMRFHDELRAGGTAHVAAYASHPILARTQPTLTTARLADGRITPIRTIDGRDEGGDGTVPRLSAAPYGVAPSDPIIRYVMEQHGALPANDPVLAELDGVLTARDVIARGSDYDLGVIMDDVAIAGEPLVVTVEAEPELAVRAAVHRADGSVHASTSALMRDDDRYEARFDALPPDTYTMRVGVRGTDDVVTTPFVVIADDADG